MQRLHLSFQRRVFPLQALDQHVALLGAGAWGKLLRHTVAERLSQSLDEGRVRARAFGGLQAIEVMVPNIFPNLQVSNGAQIETMLKRGAAIQRAGQIEVDFGAQTLFALPAIVRASAVGLRGVPANAQILERGLAGGEQRGLVDARGLRAIVDDLYGLRAPEWIQERMRSVRHEAGIGEAGREINLAEQA